MTLAKTVEHPEKTKGIPSGVCTKASTDIEGVVQAGLCAGCGLCESMAGRDSVEMVSTKQGRVRPHVKRELGSELNSRIMAVCPGKTITGPSKEQLAGSTQGFMHPVLGPLRTWNRGWAADDKVRWKAAAGGSLTTLGSFLLETGRVQKVLHVRASTEDPTTTDALISSTPEQVVSGCQSRYGPAAPLVHVCKLLDEDCVFALIAKPCDIAAVRALGKLDDRVARQIPYMLTIFCGGLPSRNAALELAAHHGVAADDIGLARYRGNGWPGKMTIGRRSDGKEFGTTYNETWKWPTNPGGPGAGITKYDIQWRCKICPDAIGELADVSCPDGWLFDEKEGRHVSVDGDDLGQNLVLARTAVGEELVRECVAAGKLVLAPIEIKEIEQMHSDHYPRKCSWPVRLLAAMFFPQPVRFTVSRYRPLAALLSGGFWASWEAFRGTWSRLRSGANQEPLA